MAAALDHAKWLLAVANSPGDWPKMIDFRTLVQRGLAEITDLAELRAAGMNVYGYPELPENAPRVWIDAREFIRAAAVVAEQRNERERVGVH